MSESTKTFWLGIRAISPLLIGVFPFGMIYGALALNAGLSIPSSQMMSSIVFAGSAQFVAAQLIRDDVFAPVVILTIAVVNLRHVLYSASLAPYFKNLSLKWKVLLSYLLTDEAYAPSIIRYRETGINPFSHWFVLGAGFGLWLAWQTSTALGILLGVAVPSNWPLDFALPLTFIAIVVPSLKNRPMIAAAVSAGLVALLAYGLPLKLGLIVAALTGIAVGTVLENRK